MATELYGPKYLFIRTVNGNADIVSVDDWRVMESGVLSFNSKGKYTYLSPFGWMETHELSRQQVDEAIDASEKAKLLTEASAHTDGARTLQ